MKKSWIYILISCALMSSCKDEDTYIDTAHAYPIVITGQAYGYDAADGGETWTKGETIGVYMMESGTATVESPYSNIRYYANNRDDQDYFLPGNNDSILYFPYSGEQRDIAAYYPYTLEAIDGEIPINVADQSNTKMTGLLYARVGKLSKNNRKAELKLSPILTKLHFTLTLVGNVSGVKADDITLTLKGFPTSGFLNVPSGEFSYRNVYMDIPLTMTKDGSATQTGAVGQAVYTADGYVMPSLSTEGYQVCVSIPGFGEYTANIIESTPYLNAATVYNFELRLLDDKLQMTLTSSSINNWGNSGDIYGSGEEKN